MAAVSYRSVEALLCPFVGGMSPHRTRTSNPAEPRVMGTESTKFSDGSLQMILLGASPASTPWFFDPWILLIRHRAPYRGLWFSVCTESWRMVAEYYLWVYFIKSFHYSNRLATSVWSSIWCDQWISWSWPTSIPPSLLSFSGFPGSDVIETMEMLPSHSLQIWLNFGLMDSQLEKIQKSSVSLGWVWSLIHIYSTLEKRSTIPRMMKSMIPMLSFPF